MKASPTAIAAIGFMNAIATIGYVYVATYVFKVKTEECDCARDWRQNFILGFSTLAVVFGMWIMYLCATNKYNKVLKPWMGNAVFLCSLVFLYVSYTYISVLKEKECSCSKDLHVILITLLQFLNGLIVSYGITFFIFLVAAAYVIKKISLKK